MPKIAWNNSRFITSSVSKEHYPPICSKTGTQLPAIALAGRSNVGKSSLLNTLCNIRNLVKVSATPGKTQMLNFFCVDESLIFVDLPGYGFAKCPPSVTKQWGEMISTFLETCKNLQLLLFLLDIRRDPNQDDLQLLKWAHFHDIPVALVLTKVDKVNKSELRTRTQKITQALGDIPYIEHSSHTGAGTAELRNLILQAIESWPN